MKDKTYAKGVVTGVFATIFAALLIFLAAVFFNIGNVGNLLQTVKILDHYSLNSLSFSEKAEGAIAGMINELEDPYSYYLDEEDYNDLKDEVSGSYEGLGIYLTTEAGAEYTVVMAPIKGTPALQEVGVFDLLTESEWMPTAENPSYGIFYIILSSIVGTLVSVAIGVPIGILTAVFLSEIAHKKLGGIVGGAVELLAAIPSVIYGLIGMMVLNPLMYKMEKILFSNDSSHQFTGGANMLAGIIVLAVMILPTVISVSTSSLKAVSDNLRSASLALGGSKIQTIFRVVIPAAKSGILTGVVLGIGRALGEAMAINMVAGGAVNIPLPFNSVRTLTTQIVSEMGYASGTHRQVLFTVGLVLYVFIMLINLILLKVRKGGDE